MPVTNPNPLPGMGKVNMWGMSPAMDLLELISKEKLEPRAADRTDDDEQKEINILLVGQGDIRHSLRTLLKNWNTLKENRIRINLYVVENSLELHARQLLFWTIALEPFEKLGHYEKTVQFMEIFGNILIRPQTKKTIFAFAERLINVMTDSPSGPKHLGSLFKFSEMKFRERDGLVELFKFWKNFSDGPSFFDMKKHWDFRLRNYLADRYDARLGIFDWDYSMKLVEKGVSIIGSWEYKNWRNQGIAFSEFDADYSIPNLTLASVGSQTPGYSGIRTSYWGDIVTGPFLCFGVECEDKSVYEKSGECYKKKSYDVTFQNLEEIFACTSKLTSDGKNELSICENLSINFISLSNFMKIPNKLKYSKFFDVVYFGNSMVQHMQPHFSPILATDAIVMAENARYCLEFRPEQEELFNNKINELAKNLGFEPIIPKTCVEGEPTETDQNKNDESNPKPNEDKIQSSILKFIRKIQSVADGSSEVVTTATAEVNVREVKSEIASGGVGDADSVEKIQTIASEVKKEPESESENLIDPPNEQNSAN